MLRNNTDQYGAISKILHWLIAIIIIIMLIVGFKMENMNSEIKPTVYFVHKSIGTILLFLIIIRLFWRISNLVPKLDSNIPTFHAFLFKLNVKILYILMFMMPISGIIMSLSYGKSINVFNVFTISSFTDVNEDVGSIFQGMHFISAIFLCTSICIHFIAALYNHFILKNSIFKRII